jgi:hypothetical protein
MAWRALIAAGSMTGFAGSLAGGDAPARPATARTRAAAIDDAIARCMNLISSSPRPQVG